MPRSRQSPRHVRLQEILIQRRKDADLTQAELASRLRRPQSFVSKYESGQRYLNVVELIEVAEGLGCRADDIISQVSNVEA